MVLIHPAKVRATTVAIANRMRLMTTAIARWRVWAFMSQVPQASAWPCLLRDDRLRTRSR